MKKLLLVLMLVASNAWSAGSGFVEWDYDERYLDVLIVFNVQHQRWDPVAGPYLVRNGKYFIPVTFDQPSRLYRVARVDGPPQVIFSPRKNLTTSKPGEKLRP